jgi:hypothetical protein
VYLGSKSIERSPRCGADWSFQVVGPIVCACVGCIKSGGNVEARLRDRRDERDGRDATAGRVDAAGGPALRSSWVVRQVRPEGENEIFGAGKMCHLSRSRRIWSLNTPICLSNPKCFFFSGAPITAKKIEHNVSGH